MTLSDCNSRSADGVKPMIYNSYRVGMPEVDPIFHEM
jgi:hypothetical protein